MRLKSLFVANKDMYPRLIKSKNKNNNLKFSVPNITSDATYLITGALGGLGIELTKWMVEQGAQHLVLVGRSSSPIKLLKSNYKNYSNRE